MTLKSKPLTKAHWILYSLAPGIPSPLFHQRPFLTQCLALLMSARNSWPAPCFHSDLISEAIFSVAPSSQWRPLGYQNQGTGHTPDPHPQSPAALSHLVMFPCVVAHSPSVPSSFIVYRLLAVLLSIPLLLPHRSSFQKDVSCSQLSQCLGEVPSRSLLAKFNHIPPSP